jgi:hypothetical protein
MVKGQLQVPTGKYVNVISYSLVFKRLNWMNYMFLVTAICFEFLVAYPEVKRLQH